MNDITIDIEEVLKHLREVIASQAQEIAVLKATIAALDSEKTES